MDVQATLASLMEKRRKSTLVMAGAVTLLAVLGCIFLAGRSTDYRSTALLLYSTNTVALPGSPPPPTAETAAWARFDVAHLQRVVQQFDLYPELRMNQPAVAAIAHLRSQMTLLESDKHLLRITFRDDDSGRSQAVTNALAEALEAPDNTSNAATPNAAAPAAMVAPPSAATTVPLPAPSLSPPPSSRAHASRKQHRTANATPTIDELQRQIDSIDARMDKLNQEQTALQDAPLQTQKQLASLRENPVPASKATEPPPAPDPTEPTRTVLQAQLAIEKQNLVQLRERYTDAYPDVENEREKIADLETKLAALPAPPPTAKTARNLYLRLVDELTAEETRLRDNLHAHDRELDELRRRRDQLKIEMLSVSTQGLTTGTPATAVPLVNGPPPVDTQGAAISATPGSAPVGPFRILQRATSSQAVRRYNSTVLLWASGLTVIVFMVYFYFVPGVIYRDPLVHTVADLQQNLPAHVVYLGNVRRIEP